MTIVPTDTILEGHALTLLQGLPDESVQSCITSPPYYGLRDYGTSPLIWDGVLDCTHVWNEQQYQRRSNDSGNTPKQLSNHGANQRDVPITHATCTLCGAWHGSLGLEPTLALFIQHLVTIFREVRRVLKPDGTLWLNIGDSYAGAGDRRHGKGKGNEHGQMRSWKMPDTANGLKPKDLMMVPARVALALQDDGWWVRSDIIWHKPNAMPESTRDRPGKAHEYLFLLSKSRRYYYDTNAIKEPVKKIDRRGKRRIAYSGKGRPVSYQFIGNASRMGQDCDGRNKRTVWTINTQPFPGAHFAVMPIKLVEPCVLAGSRVGDIILDPFMGAGTVAEVALKHSRHYLGLELNPSYISIAQKRLLPFQTIWHTADEGVCA